MGTAMKRVCRTWSTRLTRLVRDERGAEGLEKLLIIAAVVLPLLLVLLFFKDWIVEWLSDSADQVRSDADVSNQQDPFN